MVEKRDFTQLKEEVYPERYNSGYVDKWFKRFTDVNLNRWFFDECKAFGVENLRGNGQRVYFSNHLSLWDFALAAQVFLQNGVKMPSFATGKNLDMPFLEGIGLNFRKYGVFFVDRDALSSGDMGSVRKNLGALEEVVKGQILASGQDMFVFPEGGRNGNGEVMAEGKKVKKGLFGMVADYAREGGDIQVINVAVNYTGRVEESFFPVLNFTKPANGKARNSFQKLLYYGTDAVAFASRPLLRLFGVYNHSKSIIRFGEPFSMKEFASEVGERSLGIKLMERSRQEVKALYEENKAYLQKV